MLSASGADVAAFLDGHAPGWADTQTVPPGNVHIINATESTVTVGWTPIAYTGDGGYYEVSYALSGQPWIVAGHTTDKTATSYTVEGLPSGQTYYFTVRSYTPAHGAQLSNLYSAYSPWPPAKPGPPTPTATATPGAPSVVWHHEYEAEDAYGGTRLNDYRWTFMRIQDRTDASGCSYVRHTYLQFGGYLTFTVDIPVSGVYYLWCRVAAPSWRQNSWFVRMDNQPEEWYESLNVDPAQPWGKCLSHMQERTFMNIAGTMVALYAGRPIAVFERQGKVLRVFEEGPVADALKIFTQDYHKKRIFPALSRIVVKQYPPEAAEALVKAGFMREFQDYVIYRNSI
jgi:hypothetical protein